MPDKPSEIEGSKIEIEEVEKWTWKTIIPKTGKKSALTFVFPTSEQLEADAKSGDKTKEALAKKLQRFEKRIDDALNNGLSITVKFNGDPTKSTHPAQEIESVSVWR